MFKRTVRLSFSTFAVMLALSSYASGAENGALSGLSFNMSAPAENCAGPQQGVIGIHSPIQPKSKFEKYKRRFEKYKNLLVEKSNALIPPADAHEYTLELNYTLTIPQTAQGAKIQDISLMLPEGFHNTATYELACRTGEKSNPIVFRKFSSKLHTQNFEEAPVNLLPRDCLAKQGVVTLRALSHDDEATLRDTLEKSVFRAVLWNAASTTPDTQALDVFLPSMSYSPGAHVPFYAHTSNPSQPARLDIRRIGTPSDVIRPIENIQLSAQTITAYSYRDGVDWPVTGYFDVPANTASGYYVADLQQGDTHAMFPFVVTPPTNNKTNIVIVAATNTWQAYNGWGHGSFYENEIGKKCLETDYARLISTSRPFEQDDLLTESQLGDHTFRAEKDIAVWLDQKNISYVVVSEDDLHSTPKVLDAHTIALLPSHPEYYTREMYDHLEQFMKKGGNILYLGGNGLYTRVTRKGNQIEKDENGRRHDLDGALGGFWAAHLNRPAASLLGVGYDARDYATYAPYKVLNASHPAFAGTGLENGALFGDNGSGHEMDIMGAGTPENVTVLAKGTNPKGYGADMVMINTPAGGKIFSAGSISFAHALMHDEALSHVLLNVIGIMQGGNETH